MAKRDPNARRRGESYWQWRDRLAERKAAEERKGEKVVTAETLHQGGLVEGFVTHVDTWTKAQTLRRAHRSALGTMNDKGSLSDSQYASAIQIARVAERIERTVDVQCASLEARVDCSGSASDKLVESLYDVRLERAYTEWRDTLPIPRRMIIDMVTRDYRLKAIASRYRMGWPKAQRLLRNALEDWPDIFARSMREIQQDDLDEAHQRLTRAPKCA